MAKKNSKLMIVFAAIALAAYGCRQFTSNETADTTNATTRSTESGHAGKAAQGTAPAGNRDQEAYECPRWVRTGTAEQMLNRMAYTVSYNGERLTPNWVGWVLTAEHTDGSFERKGHKFMEDQEVPAPRATYADIREGECGYQRGHICPAGDNKWSYQAQKEAFLMTNICPQNGDLNQRDWKYLEEACRDWAKRYGKIYIVAGPIFRSKRPETVGSNGVSVPDAFFKVVLRLGENHSDTKAIGFIYENRKGHHEMAHYVRSVDEVEAATGLDFFYQLDDKTEEAVEQESNLADW